MYKCLKSKNGASLIIVIMATSIIFILGVTILGIGVAEAKFSTRQVNRTQAYLSAKAGVEICLNKIIEELDTGNYKDVKTLYDKVNTELDDSEPDLSGSLNTGEDTYKVWFVDKGLVSNNRIKIYGEGFANNVKGTTAVTIQFINNPNRISLDWLNNGNIIPGNKNEFSSDPVVVDLYKTTGHSAKKTSNNGVTCWKAPSIHFVDDDEGFSLEVTGKKLILQSNLISFNKSILIKDDTECLVLQTYNEAGFKSSQGESLKLNETDLIPDGWGVVVIFSDMVKGNKNKYESVFPEGYYAFNPDIALSSSSDRSNPNKIKLITNESTINYIDEIIRRETAELGFDSTQIRWSNN